MNIRRYTRLEAEQIMASTSSTNLPVVNDEYLVMRKDLELLFKEIEDKGITDNYTIDVEFGIRLYNYLHHKCKGFNNRWAADAGFWRFMAVGVIPHLVEKRFERSNADHYWRKPSRIWPSSIWWYVHLSWQRDLETTRQLLLSPVFSTDTILNLVERTGREGTYLFVYRDIMKYQSLIKKDAAKVFRAVMKLNTAKSVVVEPSLCPGAEDGYVRSLFAELGHVFP